MYHVLEAISLMPHY